MSRLRHKLNNILLFAAFVLWGGGSDYSIGFVRRLRMAIGVRRSARMIDGKYYRGVIDGGG